MRNFFLSLIAVFVFVVPVHAKEHTVEQINSYDTVVQIGDHGELFVTELIEMDFGDVDRHGIIRSIPLRYSYESENYVMRVSGVKLLSDRGVELPFRINTSDGFFEVKTGSDDEVVSGVVHYRLSYRVDRAVVYGETKDVLLWQAVAPVWHFPVHDVRVALRVPGAVQRSQIQVGCVHGEVGSVAVCENVRLKDVGSGLIGEVLISQARVEVDEGVAVELAFSKGVLDTPRPAEVVLRWLQDNWISLAAIGLFAGVIIVKRRNVKIHRSAFDNIEDFD